jgi:hypothetical protein
MNPLLRNRALIAAVSVALSSSAVAQAPKADSIDAVRAGFVNPPDAAKPMVRWWWFGAAVVKPEILRELEQMKANGIGGAELAFVYPEVLDDPGRGLVNLPFLSAEMLDAVTYAQTEGRRLGLRIDVTLCSGWPYGGPAITLDEAVTRLRTAEVAIEPGAASVATPKLAEGETLLGAAIVNGTPNPPPRRGPGPQTPQPNMWDAASAKPFTPGAAVEPASTPRVALFFIQSHTKQEVKRAAVGAEGYVLDPFSRKAVDTHLQRVGEPLIKAFGATPPYAIFSDSLEAYGADWTPELPVEFRKRRGYDLMQHLPELVGGGSPTAEKVRHDYGVTLTELVNENYLTHIDDWAKIHHTKFRSQTYGEPAVNFASQNLVALAEGEGPQWRAFSTLRWATSANHVFGHNVTSGETFTWLHSPVFRATPLDMKAEADIDFIMGENQLIYHGWPYSPPQLPGGAPAVPEPGWSLYAAASFNDHNPWHPVEAAVNQYIARLSFLMRQGEPANQVAVLLPEDDAWASFSPAHTTMTGALAKLITPELMAAILSAGYNVDFISAEAIDKVGFGGHQVLVMPASDRIPAATLRKINAWATHGGHAIAVGRVPALDPEGKPIENAAMLTRVIALVPEAKQLGQALHNAVAPDFKLNNADEATKAALGFVRRSLPDGDIYFVVNTTNHAVHALPGFASKWTFEQHLDPDTGAVTAAQPGAELSLAPYESRVFLFSAGSGAPPRQAAESRSLADLSTNWQVKFSSSGLTENFNALDDWTANPVTEHYSGEAVYSRDFTVAATPGAAVVLEVEGGTPTPGSPGSEPVHDLLPNGLPDPRITRPGPGMHAFYDPPVREAALVTINGQAAGALWHPPYRLDVTKLLKPGQNHIEIHVYNTALNAWSAEPKHDYKPLIEKYGDRFQMQDMDKVKPVPSGLLGKIELVEQ